MKEKEKAPTIYIRDEKWSLILFFISKKEREQLEQFYDKHFKFWMKLVNYFKRYSIPNWCKGESEKISQGFIFIKAIQSIIKYLFYVSVQEQIESAREERVQKYNIHNFWESNDFPVVGKDSL